MPGTGFRARLLQAFGPAMGPVALADGLRAAGGGAVGLALAAVLLAPHADLRLALAMIAPAARAHRVQFGRELKSGAHLGDDEHRRHCRADIADHRPKVGGEGELGAGDVVQYGRGPIGHGRSLWNRGIALPDAGCGRRIFSRGHRARGVPQRGCQPTGREAFSSGFLIAPGTLLDRLV